MVGRPSGWPVVNRLAVRQWNSELKSLEFLAIPGIRSLAAVGTSVAPVQPELQMPRSSQHSINSGDLDISSAGLQSNLQLHRDHLICSHCAHPLECVEQSRHSGSWLGSLLCPNCRNEYLYAYRWGRLMRRG